MYLGLPSFVSNAQPGKRASRSRGEQRLDKSRLTLVWSLYITCSQVGCHRPLPSSTLRSRSSAFTSSEVLCVWLLNFLKQIKQISFVFVCVCFDLNILFQFADPCRMFSVNVTLVILSFKGGWGKVLTTRRLTRPPKTPPSGHEMWRHLAKHTKACRLPNYLKDKKEWTWISKLAAVICFLEPLFSTCRSCVLGFIYLYMYIYLSVYIYVYVYLWVF